MPRQPLNERFLRTSFLSGANAAYVEEMQAEYERNPGSVSDEWRHFFESLNEDREPGRSEARGPTWGTRFPEFEANGELVHPATGFASASVSMNEDPI
jgi:2-oxoglutarate dehydrogenase E1 component